MNHLTHIWQLVVRHEQLFYTSRQVPQCMQQWGGLSYVFRLLNSVYCVIPACPPQVIVSFAENTL